MQPVSGVNTTYYHGTSLQAALSIQRAGFDVGRSGSNAGRLLGDGVYVTDQLGKAMRYAQGRPHGCCVLQLEVDIGNCLHLDSSNLGLRQTWQACNMYDSAHAAEGVLGSGSKEEYCVKDPRRITQLRQVIIR